MIFAFFKIHFFGPQCCLAGIVERLKVARLRRLQIFHNINS